MTWIADRICTTETPDEVLVGNSVGDQDWFRADAKATETEAWIGGWEVPPNGDSRSARWFAFQVLRSDFPWAFSKSSPKKCIASLEMLATLCCIKLFSNGRTGLPATGCCLTGSTDNQGNTFILNKLMTTKFPSLLLLLELSETLRVMKTSLNLRWRKRDENIEADQLTNLDFSSFKESLRIPIRPGEMEWLVFDKLQAPAEELYHELQALKKTKVTSVTSSFKTPPSKRLKWRDPW